MRNIRLFYLLLLLLWRILAGRLFNRPYNTIIAGTSTDIAFDMVADFVLAGVGHLLQQIPSHQHHARSAVTALDCVGVQKRFLQGIKGAVRRSHTLDSGDLGTIHGNSQGQAP